MDGCKMKQKTRRTIENRRRAKEFVEACAGTISVPILTVSCRGNVLSMNPAARQLFGILAGNTSTPVLTNLLMPENGSETAIAVACRTQNPVSGMVKIRTTSGTRDVECNAVPFMGEDEDVLLVTVLFSEPAGIDGKYPEECAGHSLGSQSGTDLLEGMDEWEEVLLSFSRGDLRTFPPSGVQDPFARLKYLYNEGIVAVQKMVSVKDLFG